MTENRSSRRIDLGVGAVSSELKGFISRGGKMLVPHGVTDPVFSIEDTLTWYREVRRRSRGKAERSIPRYPGHGDLESADNFTCR